ncbi:MAG TPA: MarR family winged helix-turn-helix transcriptional regulator [Spirochaetia bacterium]|nr:MarR family winged helix-turn-helix transcriptional regulator [Spirochaetia bacterium]
MGVELAESSEGAPVEDRRVTDPSLPDQVPAENESALDQFLRELDEQVIPLGRNMFREFNRTASSVTASSLHLMKMITLLEHPTAKELAKHTLISDAATSQLLVPLMREGLISRERSDRDRRVFNLVLTEKGLRVIEENRLLRRQILAGHFSCLDTRERGEFLRLVRKLRKHAPATS